MPHMNFVPPASIAPNNLIPPAIRLFIHSKKKYRP
jgi:hypothetical protein